MIRTWRTTRDLFQLAWKAGKRVTVFIVLGTVLVALILPLTAVTQRMLIDSVGVRSWLGLASAVVLGALAYTAMYSAGRIVLNHAVILKHQVNENLTQDVLGMTASLPTLEHLENTEFLDRVTTLTRNIERIAQSFWWTLSLFGSVISVIVAVVLLAQVQPVLSLMALLALPPLWAAQRGERHVWEAWDAQAPNFRHERRLHAMSIDPQAAAELHVTGASAYLDDQAFRMHRAGLRALARAQVFATTLVTAGWLVYIAGFVGSLFVAIQLVDSGKASLGDVILIVTLAMGLSGEVRSTVEGFANVSGAATAAKDYTWLKERAALAAAERGDREARIPLKDAVEFRDVSFTYPGTDREVLSHITLRLAPGTTVAIVGVNGAGKTTLVKLLSGMYRPTSGAITVDGIDLADLDGQLWRMRLSAAFQDHVRFELPVKLAVGIGDLPHADDAERVGKALRAASAEEFVANLSAGVDTQLGRTYDGVELSGGQWQRLALARGLMREHPTLLILDEPTAALDAHAEHTLYESFIEQSRADDRITVLVTHRYATVRDADLVIVLNQGTITERGTHQELMELGGDYSRLYRMQSEGYR